MSDKSKAQHNSRRSRKSSPAPATAPLRRNRGNDRAATFMVALLGAILSVIVFSIAFKAETRRVDAELARRAGMAANALRPRLDIEFTRLTTVAAFVDAQRSATAAELSRFLDSQTGASNADGIFAWAPLVSAGARQTFEDSRASEDWFIHDLDAQGKPQQAREREIHFPLSAGSRSGSTGKVGQGLDLASIDELRTVLDRARSSGRVAVSAPIRLSGDDGDCIWGIAPVFHSGPSGSVTATTPSQLAGFAVGVWSVENLVRPAFGDRDRGTFAIEIADATDSNAGDRIWQRAAGDLSGTPRPLLLLWGLLGRQPSTWSTSLALADRRWAIMAQSAPRILDATLTWIPWTFLAAGLLLTTLASVTVDLSQKQSRQLATLANRLQRERREARDRDAQLGETIELEQKERRRAEEGVFREKQQFRLMFNAVPAMIWYKDTKNRFLLVNEAAASSMGRTVEEIEGKPCSEIFPNRAYELYRDDLEIIQSGRPKLGLVEQIEVADGRNLWVTTDKLPEYDAMGRVVGILVFALDITHQREAESEIHRLNEELEERVIERTQELALTNREMESFAYSVSHDLRTPLRSIDGFSHMLLEEHGDELSDSGREMLDRVRSASQRMGRLIDDLLTLTRVGRASLRRDRVDLSLLARNIAEEFAQAEPQRDVNFKIGETPAAVGDLTLLRTVLENLLGNAWKFTGRIEEPAQIEFGFDKSVEENSGAFYVRDNGVGFDMIFSDKLFGAFQRLHGPTEFEGSGIGLATVQRIVERHGGRVWASGEPDQGATFYFTLKESEKDTGDGRANHPTG